MLCVATKIDHEKDVLSIKKKKMYCGLQKTLNNVIKFGLVCK